MRSLMFRLSIIVIVLGFAIQPSVAENIVIETHEFSVVRDIIWASPKGFDLRMDIYTPKTGKSSYPVVVIYHGGGWLVSPKEIMDDMSAYIASHGDYVICNVQYRLLGDNGNTTTMDEIVGDVFGALLWVKEHVKEYKGNPDKVAVSGDSAGGHLAEMVVISGNNLGSNGFEGSSPAFIPTYLPKGKTAEDIARKNGLAVQAAVIDYGVFDLYTRCKGDSGFETASNKLWAISKNEPRSIFGSPKNANNNPELYKAVSPLYNIPASSVRKLPPQFFAVGTKDGLLPTVKEYVKALQDKGQPAEYWEHQGRPHGYLDRGTNDYAKTTFKNDGVPAVDKIIEFLNKTIGK